MNTIAIKNLPIELVKLVKFIGAAESGGQAKQIVKEGAVSVNGSVVTQKSFKVHDGDTVAVSGQELKITAEAN